MSRTKRKVRRWVGEKMYYEAMARRKDAADPELWIDLGLRDTVDVEIMYFDSECGMPCCHYVEPRIFSWEMGYRGDAENVLGLEPSCSCERCGRFLPAVMREGEEWWDVPRPVAHVDHAGTVCRSTYSF